MNLAHPPSTSMVEGEHTSTSIDRLIGLRRPSTVNSEVLLQLTADESIVDDCSTAAYRSCYLPHDYHTDDVHEVWAYHKAAHAYRKRLRHTPR